MSLTNFGIKLVSDVMTNIKPMPPVLYLAVMTKPATFFSIGSQLLEPKDSAYERVPVYMNDEWWDDASNGQKVNALSIMFPTASVDWGLISHCALCDDWEGGNVVYGTHFREAYYVGANVQLAIAAGNFFFGIATNETVL